MSFPRAKRFNYKTPDLRPSPADYNLCPPLDKGVSISRVPRFGNHSKSLGSLPTTFATVSLWVKPTPPRTRSRLSPQAGQQSFNDSQFQKLKGKIIEINNQQLTHDSSRPSTSCNVKRLVKQFEGYLNDYDFTEEFIDDSYDSFTSSEEIEDLKRIEEFELNEVRKEMQKLGRSLRQRNDNTEQANISKNQQDFQKDVLRRLSNIENNMDCVKNDFVKLITEQNQKITQLQQQQAEGLILMEKISNQMFMNRNNDVKHQKTIQQLVDNTIDNLKDQFEDERKKVLQKSEEKIQKLAKYISQTNATSKLEIEKICQFTKNNFIERIGEIMTPEIALPCIEPAPNTISNDFCNVIVKRENSEVGSSFNYENICKILSAELQSTQEFNEEAQRTIEDQNTIISRLHEEISMLRNQIS